MLRETFVKIHSAIKIPILLLYWDSPEEENRQLEKLHSTLNSSIRFSSSLNSPTL
jgi:hypothetical protein